MPNTRVLRLLALGCLIPITFGCANARFMADSMSPLLSKMNDAINRNNDVEMVRDALPASLVQLDGLIEASPNNTKYLVMAAEANNGYCFGFVEDRERGMKLYAKARDYALRALSQKESFAQALDGGPIGPFEKSLSVFGKEDVPALFWASSSWLSWVGLNMDDPGIFLDVPKIKAMLERSIELDDTYKYGVAHMIMGILYAARPVAQGGKPELAKAEFDKAFAISHRKVLVFYLMYAKYYAYQIQDRQLYVDTLNHIVSAPDDLLPEMTFANAVAKKKARRMLENVDDVF